MAKNKIVFGTETLVDLTSDTVDAEHLAEGYTAHDKHGDVITGTMSGGSMNVQVAQSLTRIASTSYSKACSLTCEVAGTYDVYWDCFRSTTGGTSGSQLHIGSSTSGSANTSFTNHVQNNHRTGVSIQAGQEVSVYVRSRSTNYYAYCGTLVIVQTA